MQFRLFIFFSIVLMACRKDVDTTAPSVTIEQPTDGIQVDVFDTIHLVMHVSDDVELANVEVKLVDINLIAAMPTAVITTSGQGGTLHLDYYIDDVQLATGQYYMQATVHDAAGNEAKDYVMLYLTETPKELKGIFAVTTSPGFVTLQCIDTAWSLIPYGTFQGDFTDLAVSNWWQQVAYTGALNGFTRCFSIDGQYAGWTQTPSPSSSAYWGNILAHGRDWLINFRVNGELKTETWNATVNSTNNANGGYYFRNFVYSGDKLFADMVDVTGTSRILGVYVSSGGAIQQSAIALNSVTLLPRDETTIYAIGNESGQGHILMYDYDQNGFWEPITLPAGQVLDATEIDVNTLLIAMDNGTIYKFTYSPVGILAWNGVTAQHIRYDEAGGTVITTEGTSIRQYDYPQTGILHQVALPDTARDVELWYNK